MTNPSQAVGEVKSLRGEVMVRNTEGEIRVLAVGDKIFVGDVIVASEGGSADIDVYGNLVEVSGFSPLIIENQMFDPPREDTIEAVSTLTPAEAIKIIQTMHAPFDFNTMLDQEPTSAGNSESNAEGSNMVNLARVTENVPNSLSANEALALETVSAISLPSTALIPEPTPGQLIVGTNNDDVLTGGNGPDVIQGGSGNDVLAGGLGADVFVWKLADIPAGTSTDKVADFAPGDALDMRDLFTQDSAYLIIDNTEHTVTAAYQGADGLHSQLIEFTFDANAHNQHLMETGGVVKIG